MTRENKFPLPLDLHEVQQQFEEWRKTRQKRERIPEKLWKSAVKLSKTYSISRISKSLRLNYTSLKNRIVENDEDSIAKERLIEKVPAPAFIELDFDRPAFVPECIVEMEDGCGARMRMCFKGETNFDLLELGKSFWRKGP